MLIISIQLFSPIVLLAILIINLLSDWTSTKKRISKIHFIATNNRTGTFNKMNLIVNAVFNLTTYKLVCF